MVLCNHWNLPTSFSLNIIWTCQEEQRPAKFEIFDICVKCLIMWWFHMVIGTCVSHVRRIICEKLKILPLCISYFVVHCASDGEPQLSNEPYKATNTLVYQDKDWVLCTNCNSPLEDKNRNNNACTIFLVGDGLALHWFVWCAHTRVKCKGLYLQVYLTESSFITSVSHVKPHLTQAASHGDLDNATIHWATTVRGMHPPSVVCQWLSSSPTIDEG